MKRVVWSFRIGSEDVVEIGREEGFVVVSERGEERLEERGGLLVRKAVAAILTRH